MGCGASLPLAACCFPGVCCIVQWMVLASSLLTMFVPTLCGPSVAVLTSRLAMPSVVGYIGWLDRCATLAYELCWTCDCLEAPRPSAADSRRLCPFSCASTVLAPLTSACVRYPCYGKLHSLCVAFVVPTLLVWYFGYRVPAASPRGTGPIGWHHHGHLASALGLGWSR